VSVFSQSVTVTAAMDSTSISIGQQTVYHITVSGPSSIQYVFPNFTGDTLVNGLEVIAREPVDTTSIENGYINLKADYLITSFDSGFYYVPPVKILAGTDTVESNHLALKVITYDVDTTDYTLFDIKNTQSPPFVLADYLSTAAIILLILLLIVLTWWFVRKMKQKGKKLNDAAMLANLPPHVAAIIELDRLKAEKLWLAGRNKEFYTRLSDILRTYIQRRFQIDAPEMTTSEILELFYRDKETQSVYQNLKQILQLADLVKFAKLIPLENDNDLSLINAYLFVNQTKMEEVQSVEEQKEAIQEQMTENLMPGSSSLEDAEDYYKKYQRK